MRKLTLRGPIKLGRDEIIRDLENKVLDNYLPDLRKKWKKTKKRIIIFRIIFILLCLVVAVFLSPAFWRMDFNPDLPPGFIVFGYCFFCAIYVFICYVITYQWMKVSPHHFSWFKEAEKNITHDIQVAFNKKRKELYQDVVNFLIPGATIDYNIPENQLLFFGRDKLEYLVKGKEYKGSFCWSWPWNATNIVDTTITRPSSDDVVHLTYIDLDFKKDTSTIVLQGETLSLDFPFNAGLIHFLNYTVNQGVVSISFSVSEPKMGFIFGDIKKAKEAFKYY